MSAKAALNDHPSDPAQPQLAALRLALETRLAALEEVLADPSRGESLEGLILDLARVATEEAQAAALQTCLDTKVEADKQIAAARASAQATLESTRAALQSAQAALTDERVASSDLRQAIDQAQEKLASFERDKQVELRAARKQFETELERERAAVRERLEALGREQAETRAAHDALVTELAREREAAGTRQRADSETQSQLEETKAQLDAERRSSADLREAAKRAGERMATLEHETSQGRTASDALAAELVREREAAAVLQRALVDAQSQIEAERASSADLQQAVEYADQRLASLLSDKDQALDAQERLRAQLGRERAEAAKATAAVIDAQQALAAARAEAEALRTDLDARQVRLEAIQTERDRVAGELQEARQIVEQREAATAPPAPSHDKPRPRATTNKPVAAPASVDEDEWQAVRLANRYVFHEEIEIQVSGYTGKLIDLSVAGCQLLSSTPLRPNQLVKVLLPFEDGPITCTGKVVWARLEPPESDRPPRYRAGMHFAHANESAIETFAASRGATA